MRIDWFTVVAETLNFLILVWLMIRFLYKPVLRAVQGREDRIAQELADAGDKEKQAESARQEFEQKKQDLDQQRASLLKTAKDEVAQTKNDLLAQARSDAKDQVERYHKALAQDHSKFSHQLIERTQHEVLAISAKVLTDLADEELQDAILRSFIHQLEESEGSKQPALPDIASFSGKPLRIRSSVELNSEDKQRLSASLRNIFATSPELSYETDPELIAGLEIVSDAHKLSWNIASYLKDLQMNIEKLLQESAPKPAASDEGA